MTETLESIQADKEKIIADTAALFNIVMIRKKPQDQNATMEKVDEMSAYMLTTELMFIGEIQQQLDFPQVAYNATANHLRGRLQVATGLLGAVNSDLHDDNTADSDLDRLLSDSVHSFLCGVAQWTKGRLEKWNKE